jgi:vesicle transport protein SEC22
LPSPAAPTPSDTIANQLPLP